MMASSEPANADLDTLRAAIARSPICVKSVALDAGIADWERTRQSADIDAVILDWIASHVRGNKRLPAVH